jgi:hypothetical protein
MTDLHIIPVHDLRDHIESADCWCRPELDEDLFVHHSMDGREQYEEGRGLQ